MKRIRNIRLACTALFMVVAAGAAHATPVPTGATVETRTFNDCPLSTLNVTNNYPSAIVISETMSPDCVGFANLHSFSFAADTALAFHNNSNFRIGADITISGAGEGEGGLRISPWYGKYVDGRFMINATSGEIAAFGGALPFYSFTGNHAITYTRGTTIRLEATYVAHQNNSTEPATIQYRVIYNGNTYDSPVLSFGEQNPGECHPHGLWGMLNEGRVGGYVQNRANTGADMTIEWENITFQCLPPVGTPDANGATVEARTFNDCPLSTLNIDNNYPALIRISDTMNEACVGFANLHSFSFSEDGGLNSAVFDNNSNFRYSADVTISGAGEGEGGLRVSPWFGKFVDGRFMLNVTSGEIAAFGGRLPFYSFTGNHGVTYTRGTTVRMGIEYRANDLFETAPATIQYTLVLGGTTYQSPVLPFNEGNTSECDHGLWGMLHDGRVGGYFQPRANTGANLTIEWESIEYTNCLGGDLAFSVTPRTLNLNSNGQWVTAHLSESLDDHSSLTLNGVPASSTSGDKARFSRSAVAATLDPGDQTVELRGVAGCDCVEGTAQVRVKGSTMSAPTAGAVFAPGTELVAQWEPLSGNDPVSLVSTFDNGATWNVEAIGIANDGSHTWLVTENAGLARLAIVRIAGHDEFGYVFADEISESENFVIGTTADVGEGQASFALRGIAPVPARGQFTVSFSLPNSQPATLAIFDLSGRRVATRDIGALGAGRHQLSFGQRETLRPGMYLVRLSQGTRVQTARAIVVQ
jgi:hypothetical protein